MKKIAFIKRKQTEFVPSSKMECPKAGFFANNYSVA